VGLDDTTRELVDGLRPVPNGEPPCRERARHGLAGAIAAPHVLNRLGLVTVRGRDGLRPLSHVWMVRLKTEVGDGALEDGEYLSLRSPGVGSSDFGEPLVEFMHRPDRPAEVAVEARVGHPCTVVL
jgi:hypothetical protein